MDIKNQEQELLSKLNYAIDIAFSGTEQHMPDVLNGVLLMGLIGNLMVSAVSFAVLVGCLFWSLAAHKKDWCDREFVYLVSCGAGLTAVLMFLSSIYSTIKIIVAPKLYLLEYAADLIK